MANEKHKFPVKKPYVNVHRSRDSTYSSTDKPDSLSYSYSCIQAFRNNQHIIGNLAALHNKRQYQEPKLYSLSGEREKPIYQPFYCSKESGTDQTGKYDNSRIRFNIENSQSSTDFQSESVLGFSDRNLLIQWFKYQLKYVNSLWPFSISKDSFIPKLCRKNRKMKMEMILNNIDEETKHKLRKYVNNLRLNIEEHSNLCNESIIEIDITPILADTPRLQDFLSFLKSIESSRPTARAVKDSCESLENNGTFKKNFLAKETIEGRSLFLPNKQRSNNDIQNQEYNFCDIVRSKFKNEKQNVSFKEGINNTDPLAEKSFWSFGFPPRKDQNKEQWLNKKEVELHQGKIENVSFAHRKAININNMSKEKRPPPNTTFNNSIKIKSNKQSALKKARLNSTIAATQEPHRDHLGNRSYIKENELDLRKHKNIQYEQNMYCAKTCPVNYKKEKSIEHEKTIMCESPCEDYVSCKCLIHEQREDYKRYRKQCLFGNGDENSNNFIKYVAIREGLSQSKIHPYTKNWKNMTNKFETGKDDDEQSFCQASSAESRNQPADSELDQGRQPSSDVQQTISREKKTNHLQAKQPRNEQHLQLKNIPNKLKKQEKLNSTTENESRINEKKSTFTKTVTDSYKNKNRIKYSSNESNSSSSNKCCMVHVEDVEKLVCAINYSNDSFSTDSWKESKNCKGNLDSRIVSENYKQISINACFESLNYSINRNTTACCLPDIASDTTKGSSTTQPNSSCVSAFSRNKTSLDKESSSSDSTLSSISVQSQEFENSSETVHEVAENKEKDRKMQNNSEFKKESGFVKILYNREEIFNNKKSSQVKHFYKQFPPEIKKSRSLQGKSKIQHNGNKKVDIVTDDASEDKIRVLVRNANKLQDKILDLNKHLATFNNQKEFEINNYYKSNQNKVVGDIKNEFCKPEKMSMVIKIKSTDSKQNIGMKTLKPNKNQLKLFFKPNKLYKSISSVFKGTSKNQNVMKSERNEQSNYEQKIESSEEDFKVVEIKENVKKTNKTSESESCSSLNGDCLHRCSLNSDCLPHAFAGSLGSVYPQASQLDSSLVLRNLDKLYSELRSQRDEINDLKKLLNGRIR